MIDWQPKETAPKSGTEVLIWIERNRWRTEDGPHIASWGRDTDDPSIMCWVTNEEYAHGGSRCYTDNLLTAWAALDPPSFA